MAGRLRATSNQSLQPGCKTFAVLLQHKKSKLWLTIIIIITLKTIMIAVIIMVLQFTQPDIPTTIQTTIIITTTMTRSGEDGWLLPAPPYCLPRPS